MLNSHAKSLHAFVESDNHFQRMARVLQAMWRERLGIEAGEHSRELSDGRVETMTLGSRLPCTGDEENENLKDRYLGFSKLFDTAA